MLDEASSAGRLVVFDGNFRPAGWASVAEARASFAAILDKLTIALPTFDDEQALWGDASPEATAARMDGSAGPTGGIVDEPSISSVVTRNWLSPVRCTRASS